MQPAEALGVAAQVAVTLAGFAGIVVVFRPRSVHEWPALDQFRLRLLLTNSAMPLASALFGILLLTFDPPPVAIWRWCSGLALVMQVPFIINSTTARKRVPAADFAAEGDVLHLQRPRPVGDHIADHQSGSVEFILAVLPRNFCTSPCGDCAVRPLSRVAARRKVTSAERRAIAAARSVCAIAKRGARPRRRERSQRRKRIVRPRRARAPK